MCTASVKTVEIGAFLFCFWVGIKGHNLGWVRGQEKVGPALYPSKMQGGTNHGEGRQGQGGMDETSDKEENKQHMSRLQYHSCGVIRFNNLASNKTPTSFWPPTYQV